MGSVYLDSTTVVTAVRLLAGERSRLTPPTLWDLATVAQRVVMCERIYYTGAPRMSPARSFSGSRSTVTPAAAASLANANRCTDRRAQAGLVRRDPSAAAPWPS